MIVSFPYTNPIVFSDGSYENFHDAHRNEVSRCFIQPFAKGDLITFQLNWRKAIQGKSVHLKLEVVINNIKHPYRYYSIAGETIGGELYTSYFKQVVVSNFANGYYVFSNKINDIKDDDGYSLLKERDVFYFVVTIDNIEYKSNRLEYIRNVENTKLLFYNQTNKQNGQMIFDTDFSLVARGYNVRLPAVFAPPMYGANKEIFESYQRDINMIAAQPFENISIEIGRFSGLPDWFIRNLNTIFLCDLKMIDGVGYELISQSEFKADRPMGYNASWLNIELAKKTNTMSFSRGAADSLISIVNPTVVVGRFDDIIVEIETDVNRFWYLTDIENMLRFDISRVAGRGSSDIAFTLPANLTGIDQFYRFNIVDILSEEIISVIEIQQEPRLAGISIGTVGDTLYAWERRIIN